MNIFVAIPVHNRINFTHDCLEALSKQTYSDFKIVVVDDGSTDGTSEMIREKFSSVHLLRGNGQLWWTGGINMGIKYALDQGADYVLTLNDDVLLPENFIEKMALRAEEMPQAVFGALERDQESKKPIYAGQLPQRVSWPYIKSRSVIQEVGIENLNGVLPIALFHGRGLWIPKQVFKSIGLFDQKRFPHYLADYDFTVSLTKKGFKLYCNCDAPVYSFPEESGEKKLTAKKSLTNFYEHLFGRRGGANLADYTRFVLKHCPKPIIPVELTLGYSRRFIGYWLN